MTDEKLARVDGFGHGAVRLVVGDTCLLVSDTDDCVSKAEKINASAVAWKDEAVREAVEDFRERAIKTVDDNFIDTEGAKTPYDNAYEDGIRDAIRAIRSLPASKGGGK